MNNSIILGGGLSSLVAALTLSDIPSNRVLLFTDSKPFGAHFLGQNIEGYSFDNGMIYAELAVNVEESKGNVATPYSPERRYDWTRFGRQLNSFLSENISLVQVGTPLAYIHGAYYPDLMIADRLDSIVDLVGDRGPSDLHLDDSHPKYKNMSSYWDNFSYIDAAKISHGEDLCGLIEGSFLKKICPPDQVDKILARYHRMLWLPLYYPETIKAAMLGSADSYLNEYRFFSPESGFVGELVRNLVEKLKARENVELYMAPIESLVVNGNVINIISDDSVGPLVINDSIYSGLPMERLFKLGDSSFRPSKAMDSTGVHICYAIVEKRYIKNKFSTLNILDSLEPALRISNMDSFTCNSDKYARVTIEYPLDFSDPTGGLPPVNETVRADICKHIFKLEVSDENAICILKKVTLNKALALPTLDNLALYRQSREFMAKNFPLIKCFGSASHYGSASMNDQIIQGLSIGKGFYE